MSRCWTGSSGPRHQDEAGSGKPFNSRPFSSRRAFRAEARYTVRLSASERRTGGAAHGVSRLTVCHGTRGGAAHGVSRHTGCHWQPQGAATVDHCCPISALDSAYVLKSAAPRQLCAEGAQLLATEPGSRID